MTVTVPVFECGVCFRITFATGICEPCTKEVADYLEAEGNSPIQCLNCCRHGDEE